MNDPKPKTEEEVFENNEEGEPDSSAGETDLDDIEETDLDDTEETDLDDTEETIPPSVEAIAQAAPPVNAKWSELGPRLWNALHGLLAGDKEKHDDKYVIHASHEAVGEAHDVLKQ